MKAMRLKQKSKLNIKETVLFGMLGALMYASMKLMEIFPNVHLIGVFVVASTVVFRRKALYPLYIFVIITGLFSGFGTWWIPYLYVWTLLWASVMLLPKSLDGKKAVIIYSVVCSLHGFLFGVLYAPFQAIVYNLNFEATLAWIATGLPFDITHGISNLISGAILIVPITKLLKMAKKEL